MGGYEKLDGVLQCAKTLMSGPEEKHSVRITPIDGIERLQPALPPCIPWVQKLKILAQVFFSLLVLHGQPNVAVCAGRSCLGFRFGKYPGAGPLDFEDDVNTCFGETVDGSRPVCGLSD